MNQELVEIIRDDLKSQLRTSGDAISFANFVSEQEANKIIQELLPEFPHNEITALHNISNGKWMIQATEKAAK